MNNELSSKNDSQYWSSFWKERWQKNETGFHQEEINKNLTSWWRKLKIQPGTQVFVPLCGKSNDMLWLLQQGHKVLGIELSNKAVEEFFIENQLEPEVTEKHTKNGSFMSYRLSDITILCGDIFSLTSTDLKEVSAVYDRASLIALPPELRKQYSDHLKEVLPLDAQTLLVTLEYPQQEMSGPPFSVSDQEIKDLYGSKYQIEKLNEQEILQENDRFKQRGLTSLKETVYRLY
ncbi:MAG: thiopurine S-methyltransferase [Gammaproteobacteria bacterium]